MKNKKIWTVTVRSRDGIEKLVEYLIVGNSVAEASKKASTLARGTWGRDYRIDKVSLEGTIDA
jgi:hypothetical protein